MTEDRRTLADVEIGRDRASNLFDQVSAERNQLVRRVNELESTLRDVTGGDYDLGYSPADTIKELREELAAAKAQRDAAIRWAWAARAQRDTRVLHCVRGVWEDVELPEECPPRNGGPSGARGEHVTRRVYVPVGDGWEGAAAEDGVTLAVWIAGAAAQRFRRRNPAR